MNTLSTTSRSKAQGNLRSKRWFALAFFLTAAGINAQSLTQTQALSREVAFESDGYSVAISGDYMVVGGSSTIGYAGVVNVYHNNAGNWALVDSFSSPDSAPYDRFGSAVAIDGYRILVGAPGESLNGVTNSGAAYLYELGTPYPDVPYMSFPDSPVANAEFGYSVAISGDTLVIGAPYTPQSLGVEGAAFVYRRNLIAGQYPPWKLNTTFFAPPAIESGSDLLGYAVATDGAQVLVGAPLTRIKTCLRGCYTESGVAYLYTLQNGTFGNGVFFEPPNPQSGSYFGSSVAINSATIAVGATVTVGTTYPFVDIFSSNGSTTYTFTTQINSQLSNTAPNDHFGHAVALNGTSLAVGAPNEPVGIYTNLGAVYVYDQNSGGCDNWGLSQGLTINASSISKFNTNSSVQFGTSVAFDGVTLVGGGPYASVTGAIDVGAAFVFSDDDIFHDGFDVTTTSCE